MSAVTAHKWRSHRVRSRGTWQFHARRRRDMSGLDELFGLRGATALITGSSRGIGRAIAERMAQAGARVVISSRNQDACDEVAQGIRAAGGEAIAVACNISTKAELEQLVSRTRDAF